MSAKFPLSLVISAQDKGALASLKSLSSQIERTLKPAAALGKSLTLGVSAPLAAIGAAGVAAFTRFQTSMANVSTLIDTNVESMSDLEAGVMAVTRAVKVKPLAEMTEALAIARGTGVEAADQFKVLEGSAKLAVAGLGTTAEAVNMVVASMNAWNLKGKEAEGVYNTIFQAANKGGATLSQLVQGFGSNASIVASAGVKLDEYLASVAAMTTTMRPASEAHTQLKSVITGLTAQSETAAAVFRRLNVKSFKELIATTGGLVPALEKVRGVIKDNDKHLLNAVGGGEAFAAVLDLTGARAGSFKDTLAAMRSGMDGVGEAYEKQAKTTAAAMQNMRNNMESVAISIGRVVAPVFERLAPMIEAAT